jgi:hypothetical protein
MAGEIKKVQFAEGTNVSTPADVPFGPADFVGILPTTKGGTGVNGSATFPTSGTVATTADITAAFEGKKFKDPVYVATTANITLSGEQTIDGFLTSASRVLVKDQGTPSQNGIYVSAAGAWSRSSDANAWDELTTAVVAVEKGTLYEDTVWICISDSGGTLGSSAIAWEQRAGSGAVDLTSDVTGVLPIGSGGTGSGTALGGYDALSPAANKGDIVSHDGSTASALAVGANGKVLVADSAELTGLKWDDVPAPLTTKGDIYTHDATVAARLPVGANGRVLVANSATSTGLEWQASTGGGDTSFRIESIAANVATINGGYLKLNDGRELATYNSPTYGVDITVNLLTLNGTAASQVHYLYIDLNTLGAEQSIGIGSRRGYQITQANFALLTTYPTAVNLSRYVPIGTALGTGGAYSSSDFTTFAAKVHANNPVAVNPKVYSLSQAVGAVGSASQIQAGHLLAAASFPSDITTSQYSYFPLAANALDGNTTNAKDLTNNGTTPFTGSNIFGGSSLAAALNGTTQYFSSTDAFFSPDLSTTAIGFGGWFKAAWTTLTDKMLFNCGGTGASSYQIYITSGKDVFFAHNSSASVTSSVSIANPVFGDSSWHHFAMVISAGTLFAYIDGKLVGSVSVTGASNPSNDFTIGRQSDASSRYFSGSIEDCFFVNGYALKDSDIRKLYASKLTHNANVSAANQDWRFVLGSGVQKLPSWQPVVDQSDSNVLYADFSDLGSTETVDAALLDLGMSPVVVPAVAPFDQTYTSNPSFPISHGLSEVPSLQVGYKDASGDWHWTTGEGAVKADSTQLKGSIQTYFDASATHVRLRGVVGNSATGVKDATDSTSGLLPVVTAMSDSLATMLGHKQYLHGAAYNGGNSPTITLSSGGGSLSSVTRGIFIPYKTQDGTWRLKFSTVLITSSTSRTVAVFAVNGVTSKNVSVYYQSILASTTVGNQGTNGYSQPNSGNIMVADHTAAVTSALYVFSGDIELESKPTWAY